MGSRGACREMQFGAVLHMLSSHWSLGEPRVSRSSFRCRASRMSRNMAPASRVVVLVLVLTLLGLGRTVFSSEFFSSLTLFTSELRKQNCGFLSDWEEYAADCGNGSRWLPAGGWRGSWGGNNNRGGG